MRAPVRRLTRLFSTLLFVVLLLALSAFSVSAREARSEEEEQTDYGVYVGDVLVTPENCEDILGDCTEDPDVAPRAVYDPNKNTLTLQDLAVTTGSSSDGKVYSVISTRDDDVTVYLRGKMILNWGIYLNSGNVVIENANVTFRGMTGGTGYVQIQEGELIVSGRSTVRAESLDGVTDVCFGAARISVSDSLFQLSFSHGKNEQFGAVFYATSEISVANSSLQYSTPYPMANAFMECSGNVTVRDSLLQVTGANTCLNVLDGGKLSISGGSYLIASEVHSGIYLEGDADITDSILSIRSYQNGIAMSPETPGTFRCRRSKLQIFCDSFATMRDGVLKRKWEENAAQMSETYGSFETYADECRKEYETYAATFYHTGLYVNASNVTLTHSSLETEGYLVGFLYRSAGCQLVVNDGTALRLSASGAAMLAVVNRASEVRISTTKGNATLCSLPADDVLGEYGAVLVAMVAPDQTLRCVNTGAVGADSPEKILTHFEGYVKSCNVTVNEFPVLAIIIPCAVLGVAAIATLTMIFIKTAVKKRMQNKKDQRED